MPKHTVFLIHGIGAHGRDWSEKLDGPIETLKRMSEKYEYFAQKPLVEKVDFVPIHYDDIFQKATTRWQNDATFLREHDPTGLSGELVGWLGNASATEKNFWWTNVCDLVLYRLSSSYRSLVRTHVIDQMAQRIQALFDVDRAATCSIFAHSMGTAVAHDSAHLLGSVRWGGRANPLGPTHWRFNHIIMVSNTSRLLQTTDANMKRAYESIVRPGPNEDAASYCKTYLNIRHEADLVPFPRMFDPAGWGNSYSNVRVLHFRGFDVHNLSHHLINPRVHIPILRKIAQPKAVTHDEEIREVNEDRFPQFAGPLERVQQLKELPQKLKAIEAALGSDPSIVQLARSLVSFCSVMSEIV